MSKFKDFFTFQSCYTGDQAAGKLLGANECHTKTISNPQHKKKNSFKKCVFVRFIILVMSQPRQNQLGKESVCFAYVSTTQFTIKRSQDRSSSREETPGRN